MPELPEVETARRAVHAAAAGKRIARVTCADDPIVFARRDPRALRRALAGRRIAGTGRRGKFMWLELEPAATLVVHFGMTGWFEPVAIDASPRFLKLDLRLEDGTRLVYTDPRRLGRVRLAATPAADASIARLGFDPLLDPLPAADFRRELTGRRAPVKAVLLDQSFSAGVGNWIADEALYQARIHPARRAHTLSTAETSRLRARLLKIVAFAVEVGSDDARFPKSWLFHYRWGKRRDAVDGGGRPIRFSTVGGRTTAWVPEVQGG
jgi:formamidopyrimidine-DNA glycosylase